MRALGILMLLLQACGGEIDRLGLSAWLRVPGAQYIAGPLPTPAGGPQVLQASVSRADIAPGLQDRSLQASLEPATAGVAVGIDGDTGHWVLPAQPANVQEPNALTLAAPLVFSPQLPAGNYSLIVRAVDAGGRAGPGTSIALHTQDAQLAPAALAISLFWDTEADLDLHVIDPAGVELYWGHISAGSGLLDFDSNQSCFIDGRREERAIWTAPAAGHYKVRVDTPSLCDAATAHWRVEARRDDKVLAEARGQSLGTDTRGAHAGGAGVTALELDLP